MLKNSDAYLLVNFGGPRTLEEIEPFLISLLTDKECVRTHFPQMIHNYLFRKVAKKRAKAIESEYAHLGGGSPIYEDTEEVARLLQKKTGKLVLTYHRYLPMTHESTLRSLEKVEEVTVFPLFPQFSYSTTGSAARQLLKSTQVKKLSWIQSYATHQAFIDLFVKRIRTYLQEQSLDEKDLILLFSAHGLPQVFVDEGDPYEKECNCSFMQIAHYFPHALCRLSFQSKFGRGEWLKPYTQEMVENISSWSEGRKNLLFIPLTFTSDHIETLVEIEKMYMPLVVKGGLHAHRLPAFNRGVDWIEVIEKIINGNNSFSTTKMLVR